MSTAIANLQSPTPNPQPPISNLQSPIPNPQPPISNPQSPIPNPTDDWLPIAEAAELTGQPLRTLRWQAQSQWAPRQLARLQPPRSGRGKPTWWVHRRVDARLSRYSDRRTRDQRVRSSLIERYPEAHVARAYRKSHWLQAWRKACSTPRLAGQTEKTIARRIVDDARRLEPDGFRVSVRSLQSWWAAYNALNGDGAIAGLEALVDGYVNPGGRDGPPPRSAEAVESFYELYRTQGRLSVKVCHDATVREARRHGWSWPSGYSATARWLRENDDLSLTCLLRDGPDRWARRYLPHREIDYTTIEPGSFYVCDHTQCDFWVTHRGAQIRPWLTAILDCRSRCIVGWHLGPTPHQDAILSAMRMAYRDWAIPERMRIDNGKDFTSKLLTGITKRERDQLRREYGRDWHKALQRDTDLVTCTDTRWLGITGELGIELIYAIPYSPWSKGQVERWFGTFHGQCGKTFATYCGNSTLTRPDCLEEIRRGYTKDQKRALRKRHGKDWKRIAVLRLVDESAVPTLEEARAAVGEYLELYHRSAHRGAGMGGATPLAVWHTAAHLRRAVENDLLFLMDVRGLYRVGANGVHLKVGPAALGYGQKSTPLKHWIARDVLIAMDINDISQCWALDPDQRTLITRLEANEYVAPYTSADDAREAIAETKREQSVMHKAQRAAPRQMRTATQRMRHFRQERLAELKATGTDDHTASPPAIVPVPTGFESVSKPFQSRFEPVDLDTGDALQRFADFARRAEPAEDDTPSIWSELAAFAGKEDGDA